MNDEESSGIIVTSPNGDGVILTHDQASCVEFKGEKTQLIVKGAAGAGKSLVLMSRATKLMKEYQSGMKKGILVLTYTNSLTSYAKEFLDPKDQYLDYIRVCTFDSIVSEIWKVMSKYPDYPRGSVISSNDNEELIGSLLKSRGRSSNHRFYKFKKDSDIEKNINFWKDEFQWMLGLGFTVDDEERYLDTDRRGRGTVRRMGTADRVEAFSFYTEYLRKLHSCKQIDRLEKYSFLDRHRNDISEEFKFDHVLIDEAQDLPITAMHVAIALSKKDVLIAMDANQRLYTHRWQMKDLGIPSTSRYLKKSFRCTRQIDAFAEALRVINEKYLDSDDLCDHNVPDIEGSKPLVIQFPDQSTEMRVLVGTIRHMLEDPRVTIAVILRTWKEIDEWSEFLSSECIYHEMIRGGYNKWRDEEGGSSYSKWTYSTRTPGLKLCTIHSAKGLEFHNVIIPHFKSRRYPPQFRQDDSMISEEDWIAKYRNLCYVAMTRARANLIISYYGPQSMYLDEINEYIDSIEDEEEAIDKQLFDYIIVNDADTTQLDCFFESDYDSYKSRNLLHVAPSSSPSIRYGDRSDVPGLHPSSDDVASAFNVKLEKAEKGDIESILSVAESYERGLGVEQDRSAAISWYREGAENGNPECMYRYGLSLVDGLYVDRDVQQGLKWLNNAGDLDNVSACRMLGNLLMNGVLVPGSTSLALNWYSKAALLGDLESQMLLVRVYRDGLKDILPNKDQYRNWLEIASRNGDSSAQYDYALLLIKEGSYDEAIGNLQASAESGDVRSQFELHVIYSEGAIVERNEKASRFWLNKAVECGYPPAEYRMYELSSDGLLGYFDSDASLRYLQKSADHGFDKAINELSRLGRSNQPSMNSSESARKVIDGDQCATMDKTSISSGDPLIDELESHGFEVIDRRDRNGALWVVDSPGVREYMEGSEVGVFFKYSSNGSRSTNHRSGWYM